MAPCCWMSRKKTKMSWMISVSHSSLAGHLVYDAFITLFFRNNVFSKHVNTPSKASLLVWLMDTNGRSVSQLWIWTMQIPAACLCNEFSGENAGGASSSKVGQIHHLRALPPFPALMAVLDQHAAWVSECPHWSFVRFHSFSSLGTKFQDESHSSLETLEQQCGHMTHSHRMVADRLPTLTSPQRCKL